MKAINIKGYELTPSSNPNDYDDYNIIKEGKIIAHLREQGDSYSVYIIEAGGSIIYNKEKEIKIISINYEKETKNKKPFKILSFLTNVIDDIEDYYERSRCFI